MKTHELQNAMKVAGIPDPYHDRNISLKKKFEEETAEILTGYCKTPDSNLVLLGAKRAQDAMYMVARGLIIRGHGVQVVGLPKLIALFQKDSSYLDSRLDKVAILGIPMWQDRGDVPLDPEHRYQFDWWLQKWLMDGKKLVLQDDSHPAVNPGQAATGEGTSKPNSWWSRSLRQRISESNKSVALL